MRCALLTELPHQDCRLHGEAMEMMRENGAGGKLRQKGFCRKVKRNHVKLL
jgi:hypothetical protein